MKRSASSTNMTCLFFTNNQSVLRAKRSPDMAGLALRSVCGEKKNNAGRKYLKTNPPACNLLSSVGSEVLLCS